MLFCLVVMFSFQDFFFWQKGNIMVGKNAKKSRKPAKGEHQRLKKNPKEKQSFWSEMSNVKEKIKEMTNTEHFKLGARLNKKIKNFLVSNKNFSHL